MNLTTVTDRHRAIAMELAADLDARNVEMRVLTATGKTVVVVCPRDSIFALQKHIEKISRACPEIATWRDQGHARRRSAATDTAQIEPMIR